MGRAAVPALTQVSRLRRPVVVLAAGFALVLGAASCGDGSPGRGGIEPTSGGPLPVSTPEQPSPATAAADQQTSPAPPARRAVTGKTQERTFVPTTVRLRTSGRAATVEQIDTRPDGSLALPTAAGRVGWWRSGASAGSRYGTVVLAGHIDTAAGGVGYFAGLLQARTGDIVELSGSGLTQRYRVTRVEDLPKTELSGRSQLFSQAVPGRLLLVTCTGRFDRRTRHYDHNRLVYADPAGSPTVPGSPG